MLICALTGVGWRKSINSMLDYQKLLAVGDIAPDGRCLKIVIMAGLDLMHDK